MECKGYILNIGKAAKLSNLTVKTVRYYADIGLVKPLKNSSSGYRDFSEDAPWPAHLQVTAEVDDGVLALRSLNKRGAASVLEHAFEGD